MTCVAWDGKSIAADKQATCADMKFTTTKLRKLPSGDVLTWTGEQDSGEVVAKWYADGADPAKWPDCQKDKDLWSRLIVASAAGVRVYERQPTSVPIEDAFMAWGAGRDFAMGAMARGATAEEAVKIAIQFNTTCGCGVDVVTF